MERTKKETGRIAKETMPEIKVKEEEEEKKYIIVQII
jgi:hypothetical protein